MWINRWVCFTTQPLNTVITLIHGTVCMTYLLDNLMIFYFRVAAYVILTCNHNNQNQVKPIE